MSSATVRGLVVVKECLVHFPSIVSRPDMILWENADCPLDEVVPESTASTRHAFVVVYSKFKGHLRTNVSPERRRVCASR